VEWSIGEHVALRWSREPARDAAPYWDLATGRPLGVLKNPVASPNEVLRFQNVLYERQNGSWRTADGQSLPPLPEGYALERFSPDCSHALLTGPLDGVELGPDLPPQALEIFRGTKYQGLWLFRVDPDGWHKVAGTMFGDPGDAPAAWFAPDHRAVNIEGAWAYRFRPEGCRLWFPSTGVSMASGPCGVTPVGEDRWVYTDEDGRLCICSPRGKTGTAGFVAGLDEPNQLVGCSQYVVTGGAEARIWDQDLKPLARLKTGLVWGLCAGGKCVLTRSQTHVMLWSVPEGKLIFSKEMADPDDQRFEPALHAWAAGDWFLVARFTNMSPTSMWAWALNSKTLEQRKLQLPANTCRFGARIRPDGRLLVITRDDRWSLYSGRKWQLCAQLETRPTGTWAVTTPTGDRDATEDDQGLWARVWQGDAPKAQKRGWFRFFG